MYYQPNIYGTVPYEYDYEGTITAGDLTSTINTSELVETSIVSVYTSNFAAGISNVVGDTTNKTITVTIPEVLESDLKIKVRVVNR